MDISDLEPRMRSLVMLRCADIMSSVKVGDYVNLLSDIEEEWDDNLDDSTYAFYYEELGGKGGLTQEDKKYLNMLPWDYVQKLKVPALTKIYRVYDVEEGVPQLELIPPYSGVRPQKIDLMEHYLNIVDKLDDIWKDSIEETHNTRVFALDNFIIPEKDYVDSILLESTYEPYSGDKNAFFEFKKMIKEKASKTPRSLGAKKAAETRKANKAIDEEFKVFLKQLEQSDDSFYDEVRGV